MISESLEGESLTDNPGGSYEDCNHEVGETEVGIFFWPPMLLLNRLVLRLNVLSWGHQGFF